MNIRCQYCGKRLPLDEERSFCSDACAKAYDEAVQRDMPKAKYLMGVIGVAMLIIIFGGLFIGPLMTGIGCIILGLGVLIWPFCTPETVRMFGYQRSRVLARILAVLCILLGAWIGFFPGLKKAPANLPAQYDYYTIKMRYRKNGRRVTSAVFYEI